MLYNFADKEIALGCGKLTEAEESRRPGGDSVDPVLSTGVDYLERQLASE